MYILDSLRYCCSGKDCAPLHWAQIRPNGGASELCAFSTSARHTQVCHTNAFLKDSACWGPRQHLLPSTEVAEGLTVMSNSICNEALNPGHCLCCVLAPYTLYRQGSTARAACQFAWGTAGRGRKGCQDTMFTFLQRKSRGQRLRFKRTRFAHKAYTRHHTNCVGPP